MAGIINEYSIVQNGRLYIRRGANIDSHGFISEQIGVGIGISFLIHLLRVPTKTIHKVQGRGLLRIMDFETFLSKEILFTLGLDNSTFTHCSDRLHVQLETKGAIHGKSKARHADSIRRKKLHTDADILIGTIACLQSRDSGCETNLVVIDPPAHMKEKDYGKISLLHTLRYYLVQCNLSGLAETFYALHDRISIIEQALHWEKWNGVPLQDVLLDAKTATKVKLPIESNVETTFLGRWTPSDRHDGNAHFYGIREQVLNLIYQQEYNKILSVGYDPVSIEDKNRIIYCNDSGILMIISPPSRIRKEKS